MSTEASSKALDLFLQGDATLGAESSCNFLSLYQYYYDWNVYDSTVHGSSVVDSLINMFISFHGRVKISSKERSNLSIYSPQSLGLFRYKMNAKNSWQDLGYLNKLEGFLVEGAYWNNGLFYRVVDKSVIQSKLFVDDRTLMSYSYPSTKRMSELP